MPFANQWTWIIVHHSDSDYGSAAVIDKWHRDRGFDELGYHSVIGNGTNSGDGQIEVGPRWKKQKMMGVIPNNALDNRYNEHGIGICLVGDFDKTRPTAAQRRSLTKLILYLMRTYEITPDHVLGHGETKDTEVPAETFAPLSFGRPFAKCSSRRATAPPTAKWPPVRSFSSPSNSRSG